GCCFGDRCELPWAVTFPVDSVPFNAQVQRGFLPAEAAGSLPIHPTQLYSVIDGLLLCLLTLAYYPVRSRDGSVVTLGLLTYPITRFLIERLRGDEMGQFGTSLTIAQWISLAMLAGGIGLAITRPPLLKQSSS
ncbi:MAG TPA: prolipoprotein diacylglyceryl transferase family protein, partial [Planctomycetaceae bacterium]|nr:prolipoprotein diacylglyceryl transferase family protein [Planctomycetaceae bacterium]